MIHNNNHTAAEIVTGKRKFLLFAQKQVQNAAVFSTKHMPVKTDMCFIQMERMTETFMDDQSMHFGSYLYNNADAKRLDNF